MQRRTICVQRSRFLVRILLLGSLLTSLASAQDTRNWFERPGRGGVEERLRALQQRLDRLEGELEQARREGRTGDTQDASPEEVSGDDAAPSDLELSPVWDREPLETPRALRGTYDRPFLASLWRKAHVGGYTELEYHDFEDGVLGIPEGFRMHRTNLFLFTDISDRVRFGSEIEFETEFEGEGVSDEIEVALEMAFVDWTIYEEFKLRGGAIVLPLGRINVNHDGPARELTERPLVSTFVIPTTLTDVGVGAHGRFEVNADLALSYETYAVNGFNLLDENGELAVELTEREKLLREGRTSLGGDINSGVASVGRLSVQALQNTDVGFSWHTGTYDEEGDNFLKIFAGDLAFSDERDWVEYALEGEIAVADFERDSFARTAGVPDRFWGYYVQASLGGIPPSLRESVPHAFDGEGSTITLVFRYEYVDLDGDRGEVFEPGINFRPVADTVFKFSYRFTSQSIGLRDVPGREDWDDDGFVFSLSSYF